MPKGLSIVVTGLIGSGKSTVCRFFNELGAEYISSDDIAKSLIKNNPQVKTLIDYFLPDYGSKEFVSEIFKNSNMRYTLNSIVHPFVLSYLRQCIRKSNIKVIEIPLFIETRAWDLGDKVVVAYAPIEVIIKRIKEKWNCTREEARMRILSQLPQETKLRFAHYKIDTSVSFDYTQRQVETIWKTL
ncbi:MAG: dephospho-CoA kinase [bacterium]